MTPEQKRTLEAVLDEVIPPSSDEKFPGAGSLGLTEEVETKVGARWTAIAQGLAKLDELSRSHGGESFAALANEERQPVLKELAMIQPTLLPSLIAPTYSAYYRAAPVIEALGRDPRPPYPEGYELDAGDLSLLDPVRARSKLYRKV